jgi:Domain of unknown function (DUF4160)
MPTISLFYGISIQMFYDDHPPPHLHARYNEFKARYDIASGALLSGQLPKQAHRLVQEWIALHTQSLRDNWARMENGEPMEYIQGLE